MEDKESFLKSLWKKSIPDIDLEQDDIGKTYKSVNLQSLDTTEQQIFHDDIPIKKVNTDAFVERETNTTVLAPELEKNTQDNIFVSPVTTEQKISKNVNFTEENTEVNSEIMAVNPDSVLEMKTIRSKKVKVNTKIIYSLVLLISIILCIPFLLREQNFNTLTAKHSFIEKIPYGDCFVCHQRKSFAFIEIEDSTKCIGCHMQQQDKQGLEKKSLALNPHGLSQEFFLEEKQLSCTNCHQEHLGRNHNISSITNELCQSCHKQQYNNFEFDHPEFTSFPYERRTRIIFDHTTHFETYFPNIKNQGQVINIPETCNDCHKLDGKDQLVIIKTFEEACMQCHQKDILKTSEDINVIRFPGFNVEGFYEASKNNRYKPEFSQWPSLDIEDFGEVTDIMRLLLSKDKEFSDAEINEKLDFWINDVFLDAPETGNKAELKAINTFILMMERFCNEIAEEDNEKLKARFEKVLGASVANDTINKYFPDLSKILQVAQKTLPSIVTGKQNSSFEFANKEMPTGWYYENYTIKYRPTDHQDPVLKNWLDLTAKHYKEKGSTQYIFEALSRCTKCHSVDKSSSDEAELEIQWKPLSPSNEGRFNKFSHKPHLLNGELRCLQCHTLKNQEVTESEEISRQDIFIKNDYNSKYQEKDPYNFMSNFKFINKDLCSQCHTKKIVGENCTMCHNYHVGSFSRPMFTSNEQTIFYNKKE